MWNILFEAHSWGRGERFESRALSSQRNWRRDTFVWRTNGSGAVESRNGARPIDTRITNSVNSVAAFAAIRGAGRRGFTEWMTGVSRAVWRLMEESVDLRNRLLDGWSQEAITLDPGVATNGDAYMWTKEVWIKSEQDGNYFWSPEGLSKRNTWLFQASIRLLQGTLKANISLFCRKTGPTFDDQFHLLDYNLDQPRHLFQWGTSIDVLIFGFLCLARGPIS